MIDSLLLEDWLRRYESISLQNQKLLKNFYDLLCQLKSKNIEILPLKGMDLILRGCTVLGQRSLSDIDILVREEALSKTVECLKSIGFFRRQTGGHFLTVSFADESVDYISRDRTLILDLIWRIWYLDFQEMVWSRTVLRQTPIGPCRLLHPQDALLYRIAHAVAWGRYRSSAFIQDLQGLLQKEGDQIDWGKWISEVKHWGMSCVVFCGLGYARQKGLKEIPEEIFIALQPRSLWERLTARYYAKVTKEKTMLSSYLSIFLAMPGWKKKSEFLKRVFFPSASFVTLRQGKQSFWIQLLVGIFRPFRIFARILYFIPRELIKVFLK